MKVLIANDTYPPDVNGAAYFTKRLAEGLAERGHEVHVLCPSTSRQTEVVERSGVVEHRMRSLAVPFHIGFRFSPPPLLYRRVLAEVERIRPDVVHAQGHFFIGRAVIRAAKELGIPVIATNHFMPDNLTFYLGLPDGTERRITEWAWRDFARVFNRADIVTAPTPFAAELAEEKGVRGPVLPISCGMDLSRFNPGNDVDAFKLKHGIPEQPTFMYVGRLDAEKRVDELIRALPLVRESVDAQLVIVGDGHERRRLVDLAEEEGVEGYVIFTGFVPDEELPGAYAACDVFCNAGVAELQSIVTLEAMATGKPVVGANASALPLLVHDGENGHLFEPGDVDTLASRLTEILSDGDERAEMGEESLRIVARHDIEETLSAFEELYELVLPSRSGTAIRADLPAPASVREGAASGDTVGVPAPAAASYMLADDTLALSGAGSPQTSTHKRRTAS
ncbi:MAG: Glycosyltransferase [uncultured Rubrobacteraceae bacterium]|uniref:Glycosyltransferase n=1 Tax=uncultured Rubrobacteraceae bacterium TaxID=349277 RepID=A0A6J4PWD6_9ACTN|nr:MAG: Glycosyltransferase [uncultured Rubrobacteraceae bacterium]